MRFETRIQDIIIRTHDVKSYRFPRPPIFEYKAGQWMFISIKIGEEVVKKHFTISSSPTEADHIEFTKKITESQFSTTLDKSRIGDWALIEGPYGRFILEREYDKIGMLSGGIGITPLRSIYKYCTDMQFDTKLTLIYGSRSEDDIVFKNELFQIQELNKNFKAVFTLDEPSIDWTGYSGYITVEMIKKEIPDYTERVFYICGPPAMVTAMERLLKELELPKEKIKKEHFSGY